MKEIEAIKEASLADQADDFDYIVVVCGNVGLGKSSLLLRLYVLFWLYFFPAEKVNLKYFTVHIGEWTKAWHQMKDALFLFLDEAGDKLTNDTYSNKFNRQLRGTLSVVRKKRTILFIAMPYFMKLDNDIRTERVDCAIEVYARGKVRIFPKKLIDKANRLYAKGIKCKNLSDLVYSPYRDDFPRFDLEYPELWKEYKDKISGKVDTSLLDLMDSADDSMISEAKACKVIDRSRQTLAKFRDSGELPHTEKLIMPDGKTIRYKYDVEDLMRLKEKINIKMADKADIADIPMHTVIGGKQV